MAADAELKALERFVGTWRHSGGLQGTSTYRWLNGGFFLVHEMEAEHDGKLHTGIEIIGRERPPGAERPSDIKSRYYGDRGDTLDYVWKIDGNSLTIWFGEKGSEIHFIGTISPEGNTISGEWVGSGGYKSSMTRIGE